ncbi:MAG: uroporphyrinogen decarboxylase family protein [Anaerolineae bacterium]|nr:uroporphyrinogen decarboxylase family protein [Anaerolineae bacterium]
MTCGMPAYAKLAGVRYDLTFFDYDAIVEAYEVGYPRARDIFGDHVNYSGPGWSGISYGHVNCLGSPLTFPIDSDVAHAPIYATLEQGINALQKTVDWSNAGLLPRYLKLWQKLKIAYPDMSIPFQGFGVEGPVTTAWELRGHDFFTDIYDAPQRTTTFLRLVTESIVDYMVFVRQINNQPAMPEDGIGMVDDISALLHPDSWETYVVPYHEFYFSSQTSGRRHAHIERLFPAHLPFLDALKLDSFDPSVSPTLRPADISTGCNVPFMWRLNAMQVRDYTLEQVRDFVYQAVAEGASGVFSHVGRIMTTMNAAVRIKVFIRAAQHVARLLSNNVPASRVTEYKNQLSFYL